MSKSADHIRIAQNGDVHEFICEHCGEKARYLLPMRVNEWLALAKTFKKNHRQCKPTVVTMHISPSAESETVAALWEATRIALKEVKQMESE